MGENQTKIVRLCRLYSGGFFFKFQNERYEYSAFSYRLEDVKFEGEGEFELHNWDEVEIIEVIDDFYVSDPVDFNKRFSLELIQKEYSLKDSSYSIQLMDFKEYDNDVLGTANLALEEAAEKYDEFKASFELATSKDDLKMTGTNFNLMPGLTKWSLACRKSVVTWEISVDHLIYIISGYRFYLEEVLVKNIEGSWFEIEKRKFDKTESSFLTSIDDQWKPKYRFEVDGLLEYEFSLSTRIKDPSEQDNPTYSEFMDDPDYFDSFNLPIQQVEQKFIEFIESCMVASKREHLNIEIKKKNEKDEFPGLSKLFG